MGEYRLSTGAVEHLEAIYTFTYDRFVEYQAEAYLAGLHRTLGLLADFPLMGSAAFELQPNLRRFGYQSHVIFHPPTQDHVLIRAAVHGKRNIRRDLFDA